MGQVSKVMRYLNARGAANFAPRPRIYSSSLKAAKSQVRRFGLRKDGVATRAAVQQIVRAEIGGSLQDKIGGWNVLVVFNGHPI